MSLWHEPRAERAVRTVTSWKASCSPGCRRSETAHQSRGDIRRFLMGRLCDCKMTLLLKFLHFPHSSVSKESVCNAGDPGSIPGSGRSPGERNGNPLQYSCLENPTDRGAWQATIHGVARVGHDLATKPPPPLKFL